jgi:hypothetical protein
MNNDGHYEGYKQYMGRLWHKLLCWAAEHNTRNSMKSKGQMTAFVTVNTQLKMKILLADDLTRRL